MIKVSNVENIKEGEKLEISKEFKTEIEKEELRNRHNKLLKSIFVICELAGFKVESRIVLRDKKTGRVWK